MLKNYIALFFGATLLYGCGGSNSFDSTEQEEQYTPTTGDVVDIGEGDSGYRFDLKGDNNFTEGDDYRNFVFRAMDPNDEESLKEANAAYRFLRTWTTNTAGSEEEVDFSTGDAVAITIGYTDLEDETKVVYSIVDFDELVGYGENFTQINFNHTDLEDSTGYIFPYQIVKFPLVGTEVLFTRNHEKMALNQDAPTYHDLVVEDLVRRRSEGENLNAETYNYSGNTENVLSHKCPNRHDVDLVVTVLDRQEDQEAQWNSGAADAKAAFCPVDGSYYVWDTQRKVVKGPFTPGQPATTSEKE